MAEVDIVEGVLILTLVVTTSFALMLMLPGLIECIAESIIDTRLAMDRLKEVLRGDEDGK